jgi:PKD repeat protein
VVRQFPSRTARSTRARLAAAAALVCVLALAAATAVQADPPVGDFSFSPTVPQIGQSVSFSSTATDADDASLSVSWDFGDGSAAGSGLSPSHSYASPGDKTVTMTMSNGIDAPVVVTHTLHVNAPPAASFIFSPQTPLAGQQVQFSSTSSDPDPGDTLSYSWDLNGDGVYGDSTSPFPTFAYTSAGTYQVGLKVTDSTGATSTSVEPITIQNSQPAADFSFTPALPLPAQPATFTASATPTAGQTITAIDWNFDYGGAPAQFQVDASGASVAHAFPTPGSHVVGVRVTESGGGVVIVTHTVTVDAPPVAAFVFAPSSPVAGDTVLFASSSTDPDGPIASTAWDLNGDGVYGDASGPVVSKRFDAPGVYTVGVRVTDAQGATAFALEQVDVQPAATPVPGQPATPGPGQPATPGPGVLQNVLVQMAGSVTGSKTRVRRLYVRAPAGAAETVSCRGHGCPARPRTRLSKGHRLRFRYLERRAYGKGARIVVAVTMPGFIDRVTTFKMRAGRPPLRLDRCRLPGQTKLTRCPP